jgi:predicted amidophosphoribosyltransferase
LNADAVFWLIWAAGFALVLFVIYKLLPVRGSRKRRARKPVTRTCPSCGAAVAPDADACPDCGAASAPWVEHRGSWWSREGEHYVWLDERAGEWRRYRREAACPYCEARMAVDQRRCKACGRESNPLELPDPTVDLSV